MPPPTGGDDPSPGELSRRMREVLEQFKNLVDALETKYILKQVFDLWKAQADVENTRIDNRMKDLDRDKADKTDLPVITGKVDQSVFDALSARVKDLEENNKWLMRIVIAFVIAGVLGAVFTVGGGVGK